MHSDKYYYRTLIYAPRQSQNFKLTSFPVNTKTGPSQFIYWLELMLGYSEARVRKSKLKVTAGVVSVVSGKD